LRLLNEAVNFEREAIFIAVPRTGTTSIRKQLAQPGPKLIDNPHLTILQVRDSLYTHFLLNALGRNRSFPTDADAVPSDADVRRQAADTFTNFFKFASVRNPWTRALSLYKRRQGLQLSDKMDFETFCETLTYASDTCSHPTRVLNQLDWMTDESGALLVDYVLRLEDLDNGIREINDRTDGRLGLKVLHLNNNPASNPDSYREAYSARARAQVAALFQRDIDHFGYEF